MSLPRTYNRRIMDTIGARAVWQPGSARPLGAIVVRREPGLFAQVGDLAEHGITFAQSAGDRRKLDLVSSGVRQRIIQGGAEVGAGQLKPQAQAELKLSFTSQFEFVLKAEELIGTQMTNLEAVAAKAARVPDWDFDRFCIVSEVYVATGFSFLGTLSHGSEVSFSGTGSSIQTFLKAGLKVNLDQSGHAELEIIGRGGPLAMVIARVKENGNPTFDI